MRLGISVTSSHPGADGPEAVTRVLERARAAAAAGLDHLSLGDQHATGPDATYVQAAPTIGRVLADWPADRPVGLLVLLPLWHPVLVAEQVGTLASMSEVPFVLQTGVGSGDAQFAAMGASRRERGARTDEAIRLLKALFAGERVHSDLWSIDGASVAPRPPHGVEWWIGAGTGERPLDRAAREGDAWYAGPTIGPDDVARYQERCAHHGTTPRVIVRKDVLLADDDAAAVRRGREVIAAGYRGMGEHDVAFGGVDRVAERLAALATFGVDDVVVRTMAVDQHEALRSIDLLAELRLRLAAV